jgi:hypothetical protein
LEEESMRRTRAKVTSVMLSMLISLMPAFGAAVKEAAPKQRNGGCVQVMQTRTKNRVRGIQLSPASMCRVVKRTGLRLSGAVTVQCLAKRRH